MVLRKQAMEQVSPLRQVTVVDVYDLASGIGKDFEKLIELFGASSITDLMPKVISALEMLESFANRNERETEEILALKSQISRLENEKQQKIEGRNKFEKELEQFEDNYKSEINELWEMVQKLQEENKRLQDHVQQKDCSPSAAFAETDLKMMLHLKETFEKQRDILRCIEKENNSKQVEIDQMQQQIEKLSRVNRELLRKTKAVQGQGRLLVEEKVELMSQLQDKDSVIENLKTRLGETEKAKKDLEQTKVEETCDLDRDNIPRFTLSELREVLQEKNYLKARVMELEEELLQLRPPPPPSPNLQEEKTNEDEVLVYGPINREPEEKLYPWKSQSKDKESGVRKFLNRLLKKAELPQETSQLSMSVANQQSFASSSIAVPVRRCHPATVLPRNSICSSDHVPRPFGLVGNTTDVTSIMSLPASSGQYFPDSSSIDDGNQHPIDPLN